MTGARPILLTAFLLLLAAPFALFGFLSVRILEPRLLSEFDTQTVNAVGGVQRRIDRAVSVFGDLDALRDVEQVLDHARSSARGMSFLAVTDPDGAILHLSADDPAAARGALDAVAVPDAPAPGGGFEGRVRDMTGLAPAAPVTVASRRGNDLLVTSLSLGGDDRPIGALHAGVDIGTLDALKRDIWIDTGVVVLAIVLLAVELLILGFAVYLLRPAWAIDFLTARLRDRDLRFTLRGFGVGAARRIVERVDGIIASAAASFRPSDGLRLPGPDGARVPHIPAVSHVRLPLFLFFLSEALLRPILPRFLGDFAPPGLDPEFGIGILMAGFMAASLFSVLIGSILSEGRGSPRRVFVWGTVCAGCGMSGHLVAGDFTSILLLRMLTGLGYGLVYAAAQVYIAQHADPVRRTAGFSLFLAVIVAAEICGPAIGGILADRFGDAPVVATATLAIALAAIA